MKDLRSQCSYREFECTNEDFLNPPEKKKFLKPLSLYYENPEEVLKMICEGRKIYYAENNEKEIVTIFTTQNRVTKNNLQISYLGLLVSLPGYSFAVKKLVFQHVEFLKNLEATTGQRVICYGTTTNYNTIEIANNFFQNVFPTINAADNTLPEYYRTIVSNSNFQIDNKYNFKIIKSPSVARYKSRVFRLILRNNQLKGFNLLKQYKIDSDNGDRILFLCDVPENNKYQDLKNQYYNQHEKLENREAFLR